jgi:hypothetical protein
MCGGALATAQTPATQQTPPSPTASPADQANPDQRGQTVTLVGCLYHEKDIPGRQPNVAERAGLMEDYILADARPAARSGEAGATGTTGAEKESGERAGLPKMFKVEQLADERLREFVGKRVEVTGRIDAEDDDARAAGPSGTPSPRADESLGPDDIELPEFEATSIREASGTCPATPKAPKN